MRIEKRLIGISMRSDSEEEDQDSALERFHSKENVSESLAKPCGIPVRSIKASLMWLKLINVSDPRCEQRIASWRDKLACSSIRRTI